MLIQYNLSSVRLRHTQTLIKTSIILYLTFWFLGTGKNGQLENENDPESYCVMNGQQGLKIGLM